MNNLGNLFPQWNSGNDAMSVVDALVAILGALGLVFSLVLGVMGFGGSSSSPGDGEEIPDLTGLVINPLAQEIDESEAAELFIGTNLNGGNSPFGDLLVPADAVVENGLEVNSVLSVPPMIGLPKGALIKITAISEADSSGVTIVTEPATITDIVFHTDGYTEFESEVTALSFEPAPGVNVVEDAQGFAAKAAGEELAEKQIEANFTQDGVEVALEAEFGVNSTMGVDVGYWPPSLEEMKFEVSPYAKYSLTAHTGAAADASFTKELGTLSKSVKFMAGHIPVYVVTTGTLEFNASATAEGSITYEPSFMVSKTVGFQYLNDTFSTIDETDYDVDGFTEPKIEANAGIKVGLGANLDVEFYSLAGVSGDVETWAKLNGELDDLLPQCYASVGVTPGIQIIAGVDLVGLEWEHGIYTDDFELWKSKNLCPLDLPDPGVDPTPELTGVGVTLEGGQAIGGAEQWGQASNFVLGKNSWVLSTGNMSDAIGVPSNFASSNLSNPGSPELSELSGGETFDAATYRVTVIPAGNTLYVDYAFASEEYLEFVNSGFNDVMAIFVNGQNCAVVPETNQPISVDTVNHLENSQYYVDSTQYSESYSNSFDGITQNLRCSVPVTPGVPVEVLIGIADTGDGIYDSAVALVEGGIYSN